MAPSSQNNIFITYNDPTELRSRQNRRVVSSFASKSYRPTSRKIVLDRTHYRPFIRRPDSETPPPPDHPRAKKKPSVVGKKHAPSQTSDEVSNAREVQPLDDCALGSPMADPFTTYPITFRDYVPFLVDYCECPSSPACAAPCPALCRCPRPITHVLLFPTLCQGTKSSIRLAGAD